MTGEKPVTRQRALLGFLFGCCGCILWISSNLPALAAEADAQQADMIPQDEVVVQNEGAAEDALPITYSLRIYKDSDRIKLKGSMSSEEDYKTLIGLIKANFPSVDVTDRVKVKEEAQDGDVKIGGLSFALKLLGYLETGQASVDNNGLSLEGAASTAVVLTEVRKLIDKDKPTGVPLRNIRIAPPEKSWVASVTPEGNLKISGIVPSKGGREKIAATAHEKFANFELDDSSVVNSKIEQRWVNASLRSLELLALLDKGSVEVTEQSIRLKGNAPSETALKSIDAIATDLPSGFALKSEVTAPASPHSGLASIPTAIGSVLPR